MNRMAASGAVCEAGWFPGTHEVASQQGFLMHL